MLMLAVVLGRGRFCLLKRMFHTDRLRRRIAAFLNKFCHRPCCALRLGYHYHAPVHPIFSSTLPLSRYLGTLQMHHFSIQPNLID